MRGGQQADRILDRLIVQIYNEAMLSTVHEIYPFDTYIFTMYQRWGGDPEEFVEICRWCVENQVRVITMPLAKAEEENLAAAARYDIDVYVHTENDAHKANEFIRNGVRGIYTDVIRLEDLEDLEGQR